MRDMKDDASKEQFKSDRGQREHIIGGNAGSQEVTGGHGSDVEAAKNPLFAEQDESGAKTPKAAHDVEGHHRAEIKADDARHALGENACVEKENRERHDQHKEEKHFVAESNLDAHARQGGKVFQSRSLLPVYSINTSSKEGVAISRLTSSLPWASSCLTKETIVCGGRCECKT